MDNKQETITNEQIKKVYDTLSEFDKDSDKINKAKKLTEESNYDSSEKIELDSDNVIAGVNSTDINNVKENYNDYTEVFKDYDINENDVEELINLIKKYKNNEDINYYKNLPESVKKYADGIRSVSISSGYNMSRNESAKTILKEFVNDAQVKNVIDSFQTELNDTMIEMNTNYDRYILEAFDEAFSKIDEIEATNPEQAKNIRDVKKAFEDAITFSKQKEYIEKTSANKLNKYLNKYNGEIAYFNNRVNVTEVKVPDINELVPIIHEALPQFSIENIKKFIIVICKSNYDLDVEHRLIDLAYIYRMISIIYGYKFVTDFSNESTKKLFDTIADVITSIINK